MVNATQEEEVEKVPVILLSEPSIIEKLARMY
jgi:hypothetical protein